MKDNFQFKFGTIGTFKLIKTEQIFTLKTTLFLNKTTGWHICIETKWYTSTSINARKLYTNESPKNGKKLFDLEHNF